MEGHEPMKRLITVSALWAGLLAIATASVWAVDPPHEFMVLPDDPCASCHTPHESPGGSLTSVLGNANLCISCHNPGGPAAALPFATGDQAIPGPGLPPSVSPSGNSHRWDSGPSGWVEVVAGNSSPGTVTSGGAFTGRFAKTYTLTIDSSGDAGVATFSWSATTPGGGSGSGTTGTDVALDEGITVTFTDGGSSPSFVAGDQWRIYVRTDLNDPTEPQMLVRLEDGKVMCSTCHDQHSQRDEPFTPYNTTAPPYSGPGTGAGRMFQRVDNDAAQICVDCHSPRDVDTSADGSHPVGPNSALACETCHGPGVTNIPDISITPTGPVMEVVCLSCHQPHYAPTSDGSLGRQVNTNTMCTNCHILADTATPASHIDGTTGVLWPGGQYGSNFPAITDSGKTGFCTNCHWPHGWPDDETPAQDYTLLLVDEEENLCFTCHDGTPVAPSIMAEFSKSSNHPLGLTDGTHTPSEATLVNSPDRHVECADCHNSHQATPRVDLPGPTTSPRPASGPLAGVRGIDLSGAAVDPAAFEYELCFRCHGDSTGKPAAPTPRQFPETNVRLEFSGGGDFRKSFHSVAVDNTGSHPVPSLRTGWSTSSKTACTTCHNNDSGVANGGSGPNGPHGSIRPNLLEKRYETGVGNYSQSRYDLCFECHDPNVIFDKDRSFEDHERHVVDKDMSCNYCHDPHGASSQRFLINFDTSVSFPTGGRLEFEAPEDSGDGRGRCWVDCHLPGGADKDHSPKDYDPNY